MVVVAVVVVVAAAATIVVVWAIKQLSQLVNKHGIELNCPVSSGFCYC
jgi:hypothetical protein